MGFGLDDFMTYLQLNNDVSVERIIFNEPVVVVFFSDNTKEVVKCHEDDDFDEEVGVSIAIARKMMGSRNQILKTIKDKGEYWHTKKEDSPNFKHRIGDRVRCINPGSVYDTYVSFFQYCYDKGDWDELVLGSVNVCTRYFATQSFPNSTSELEVAGRCPHEWSDVNLYIVVEMGGIHMPRVYIIGEDGLEVV